MRDILKNIPKHNLWPVKTAKTVCTSSRRLVRWNVIHSTKISAVLLALKAKGQNILNAPCKVWLGCFEDLHRLNTISVISQPWGKKYQISEMSCVWMYVLLNKTYNKNFTIAYFVSCVSNLVYLNILKITFSNVMTRNNVSTIISISVQQHI